MWSRDSAGARSLKEQITRFYDTGSPYYLLVLGRHIHDGYYPTGSESRQEAQGLLTKLLAEKAEIVHGAKVLDVGCGVGGSSIWLAKNRQAQVTGITISPVQVEIANGLAREEGVSGDFLLMDAEEMDFAEPFDVIWVVAALTHFGDQLAFLKSSRRFLTDGGKLVIYDWTLAEGVPDDDPEIESVREGLVLSHLYSAGRYEHWLQEEGFTISFRTDTSSRTISTWSGISSVLRRPRVWRMAIGLSTDEVRTVLTFFKGVRAIRAAMRKGKLRSTVIIAQKNGYVL